MTTNNHHTERLNAAVRWFAVGLFAGMAVTVWSPRAVPYVAAGLVVLAVAVVLVDHFQAQKEPIR